MSAFPEKAGPILSIVIPTFNERDNVAALLRELSEALTTIAWEVILVDDDSPDGTANIVRQYGCSDLRIRCLQRIGRRGLSTACVEGMLASSAPYIAVMDGDLQHDPSIIPTMLRLLEEPGIDLVVGSRYQEGGGLGSWTRGRVIISRVATWLGRSLVPTSLTDPMSGFFMLRRSLLDDVVRNLSGLGFKILVDIFASARHPVAFREVPFVFRNRRAGESKLDSQVMWDYVMLLADKLVGAYIPIRFLSFALIGSLGVIVHLAVLTVAYQIESLEFAASQTLATVVTMVFNYSLNNQLTYHDRRRRGLKWLTGLLSFSALCSVGAIGNVGIATFLFNRQTQWIAAAIAGISLGAVWNYAVTSIYTWGRPRGG